MTARKYSRRMAFLGIDLESDCDDKVDFKIFSGKSFNFMGFSEEKEIKLKQIAEQFGAECNGFSEYIFTTAEHAESLKNNDVQLYNVTFLRDSVDANECLNVNEYRLGDLQVDDGKLQNFMPCCALYHGSLTEDCIMCDESFQVGSHKIIDHKNVYEGEVVDTNVDFAEIDLSHWEEEDSVKSCVLPDDSLAMKAVYKQQNAVGYQWDKTEDRQLLRYIIKNNLIPVAKSSIIYKQMLQDGLLAYRSSQSLMCRFRHVILPNIESYDIPEPYEEMFIKLRQSGSSAGPRAYSRFEPWEDQLMIDYLIETDTISRAKHESVFHEMRNDGVLRHRTTASLYTRMRQRVLSSIQSYNVPPDALSKFEELQRGNGINSYGKLWEENEDRVLLDYVVRNVDSLWQSKGRPLYDKMSAEGLLLHRTPDSLRSRMTNHILRKIENYDLPDDILKQFIEFRTISDKYNVIRRTSSGH